MRLSKIINNIFLIYNILIYNKMSAIDVYFFVLPHLR